MVTEEELRNRHFYHPPTPRAADLHKQVSEATFQIALLFESILPEGRHKSIVHTGLEEVRMMANAAIALNHDKL